MTGEAPRLRPQATFPNTSDKFPGHRMELWGASDWAVTGNIRGSLHVVELRHAAEPRFAVHRKLHDQQVTALRSMRQAGLLFSGDRTGAVRVCALGPNRDLRERASLVLGPQAVRALALSPGENKLLSAHDDKRLTLTDLVHGTVERALVGHGGDVLAVDWHPRLGVAASGSKDRMLKLWDPRAGAALDHVVFYKDSVNVVRFHPAAEHLLAAGGKDQAVQVIDLRLLREPLVFKSHTADVLDLAWHPASGRLLASADASGAVYLWALPCALPLDVVRVREGCQAASVGFTPGGERLAAMANDRTISTWALGDG